MMRSPAPALRLFVSAFVTLAPLVIGGCSGSSSSSPSPSPAPTTTTTTTTTGTTATALSTSFTSQSCATCHGADGSTKSALTNNKVLKGTTLTAAAYLAAIRTATSPMSSYTAAQMSDADVTNDYNYFKTH